MIYDSVRSLLELSHQSVSPWHTVLAVEERLVQAGFQELALTDDWQAKVTAYGYGDGIEIGNASVSNSCPDGRGLQRGGCYYVKVFGSTLLAFTLGQGNLTDEFSLRLAASHTDFPGLRIKPAPDIVRDGYGVLNVESYGGLILSTWQDRPLSIAGRVAVRGKDALHPEVRCVDFGRPLLTIPSLAIHMNRKVNEGVALNKQKDMLPLMAVLGEKGDKLFFEHWLAAELGCAPEDILSYELNLYPYEAGCQLGLAGELVSAPRLDNITSVEACLQGILSAQRALQAEGISPAGVAGTSHFDQETRNRCGAGAGRVAAGAKGSGLNMAIFFDNEEIGSRTKQGAASAILLQVLERIYGACGYTREQLWQAIGGGFMLSVDVAHAFHPNYGEKYDPTNKPLLNGGVALKQAASQSYAGDTEAVALVTGICQDKNIPCQRFVNRSDQPGGSTLGSIASALVPMRTMDIGVPILAMHSARETMGAADQQAINALLKEFFTLQV